MSIAKKALSLLGLFSTCLWLFGCAQILIPGTFAGAGEYLRYTSTNVPKRTLMGTQTEVSAAARKGMQKMNIRVAPGQTAKSISPITGTTAELLITVTIDAVTPTTTRVTVDAAKGQVAKDKATAEKILDQIQMELDQPQEDDGKLSRIYLRNNCNGPIEVALYYMSVAISNESWKTEGWFRLNAGEKKLAVPTAGRYVYFYATSPEQNSGEWAGTYYQDLYGTRYGFFKVDLGEGAVDFTQTFNCD